MYVYHLITYGSKVLKHRMFGCVVLQGSRGERGGPGVAGEQGGPGAAGPRGARGQTGIPGAAVSKATVYRWTPMQCPVFSCHTGT